MKSKPREFVALFISLVIVVLCVYKIAVDAANPMIYWQGIFMVLSLWTESPKHWDKRICQILHPPSDDQ